MKNILRKVMLALLLVIFPLTMFTGCDLFGGDDPEIYTLTVLGNEEMGIEITDKNGDYEEQTKIDLTVPYFPGYKLDGWFDENHTRVGGWTNGEGDGSIPPYVNDGEYKYIWNIDHNATIHCEYTKLKFKFKYVSDLNSYQELTDDSYLKEYTVDQGTVNLAPCVDVREGYNFKCWKASIPGQELFFEDGKMKVEYLKYLDDYNNTEEINVTMFPVYEKKSYSVNIKFTLDGVDYDMDNDANNINLKLQKAAQDNTPVSLSSTVEHGEKIYIYAIVGDMNQNYNFEGFYVGNTRIDTGWVVGYEITETTNIEVRITTVSPQ